MILFLTIGILLSFHASAAPTECHLPPEQGHGSLIGSWEKLPIPLLADSRFYQENEGRGAQALRSAVATWNEWAAKKGKTAFVIQNDEIPSGGMEIPEVAACSPSRYTQAVPHAVGIWMIGKSGKSANRRPSCGPKRQKLLADGVQAQTDWDVSGRTIRNASILLNFDFFHGDDGIPVDLESLLVHELGHVLGLLHSCNGSSGKSIDGTSSLSCGNAPQEFQEATMFPYLRKGSIRRGLQKNDLDRVNCLY